MAEHDGPAESKANTEVGDASGEAEEQIHPLVTRRDFLIGAGTGAVALGVVAGAGFAASQAGRQVTGPPPAVQTKPGGPPVAPGLAPQPGQAPAPQTLPLTMREVSLDIDNRKHEVEVDVRESLWETMT